MFPQASNIARPDSLAIFRDLQGVGSDIVAVCKFDEFGENADGEVGES